MLEKELRKKMMEEERKKAFKGMDYDKLAGHVKQDMVKNAVEAMGGTYKPPPKEKPKGSKSTGMATAKFRKKK